ncbi:hypothetical protein [Lusitaniella coriacea]
MKKDRRGAIARHCFTGLITTESVFQGSFCLNAQTKTTIYLVHKVRDRA